MGDKALYVSLRRIKSIYGSPIQPGGLAPVDFSRVSIGDRNGWNLDANRFGWIELVFQAIPQRNIGEHSDFQQFRA